MFGEWGQDHDDACPTGPTTGLSMKASTSSIPPMSIRPEESEIIVGEAFSMIDLFGGPCWPPRYSHPWATTPMPRAAPRRWIMAECDNSLPSPRYRLHRSLPGPPTGRDNRHRRNPRSTQRPRTRREDPILRKLHLSGRADGRGPMGGRTVVGGTVHDRTAAVLHPGTGHRARRTAGGPVLRHGCDPLEPSGRRVAPRVASVTGKENTSRRSGPYSRPLRPLTIPANSAKARDCQPGRRSWPSHAGLATLIELALAFVLEHPAVSARHHRPPHHGAARVSAVSAANIRLEASRSGSPGRDQPARHQCQPGRRRVVTAVSGRPRPASTGTLTTGSGLRAASPSTDQVGRGMRCNSARTWRLSAPG